MDARIEIDLEYYNVCDRNTFVMKVSSAQFLMHHNCPLLSLPFFCHFSMINSLVAFTSFIRLFMHGICADDLNSTHIKLINAIVYAVWSEHTIYCSKSFRTVDCCDCCFWCLPAVDDCAAFHLLFSVLTCCFCSYHFAVCSFHFMLLFSTVNFAF